MDKLHKKLSDAFEPLRRQVLRRRRGFLKYDYLVPGGYYEEQWDWDGFFIGLHLLTRDPKDAVHLKNWSLNVLAAAQPDGYVPGCITPAGPETGHRSFQMKPFLAQGVALAALRLNDFAWAKDHYTTIQRICLRREDSHRDAATGLFFWDNAMQSGADNNPALSNDPPDAGMIIGCDINTFQFGEYVALSVIAEALGHKRDHVHYADRALALKAAVNGHLWCAADGTFWNRRRDTGEFVRRVSYSNFVPLIQALAPQNCGERMVRRYLWNEAHMLAPCGLRTLSAQDPEYNNRNIIWPYSNWQGPVWPIANYLYFRGLMTYGFQAEAAALAETMAELCLNDIDVCGSMHENYDAETAAPLAPSGNQSPRGQFEGQFVGWNLLVQNMLEELESDEDPLRPNLDESGRTLRVHPD